MSHQPARICAVITETTVAAAQQAIKRASAAADLLELRLDYLRDFDFTRTENLRSLLADKALPVILTCRAVDEGGKQPLDEAIRLPLLIEGAKQYADYCDIEAAHFESAEKLSPDLSKLIISYHNFAETPANLDAIYERLLTIPAAIHKIAVRANHLNDTLAIFQLLQRAEVEQRPLIAIAMNEVGAISRLLGTAYGSRLTYGALADDQTSAPGQFTCDELQTVYRINQLRRDTRITGIIGNPVAHSVSPVMHNAAFAALNLDVVYLPIAVADLASFFTAFVQPESRRMNWPLCGLSVTIPHKVAVMKWLDEVDESAERIGAVNTIVVAGNRLKGYNTDAQGAMEPLEKIGALKGQRCAVLGAGGAARAVLYGLTQRGAKVTVLAREDRKARLLADEFQVQGAALDTFSQHDFDILIHTTPIGMRHHSEGESLLEPAALAACKIVYDLVYNPLETRLLKAARQAGCVTISGLEMLLAQAALQFELWTGQKPSVELMRHAALKKLGPAG
ncbi:MAG: shikimate dehydrogenase [Acidobacteria bacterium]|nr:shikimate dehydrogenase [Acidobacteriota bacterium]